MNACPRPNSAATCSWTCGGVQAREALDALGGAPARSLVYGRALDKFRQAITGPRQTTLQASLDQACNTPADAANCVVINSRKRMLAHIRAGEADKATVEMEKHRTLLRIMNRLAAAAASPGQRAMDSIPEECSA
jgi:hypothetical protein